VTVESPASLNIERTPVIAVTIPTSPKSFGVRNLASITKEPVRSTNFKARAEIVTRPPRTVLSFSLHDRLNVLSGMSPASIGVWGRPIEDLASCIRKFMAQTYRPSSMATFANHSSTFCAYLEN
jgi:hypothetical protein